MDLLGGDFNVNAAPENNQPAADQNGGNALDFFN